MRDLSYLLLVSLPGCFLQQQQQQQASCLWSVEIATASVASYGGTASETDFEEEEEEEEEFVHLLSPDDPSDVAQVMLTSGFSARVLAEKMPYKPAQADLKGDLDSILRSTEVFENEILKAIQKEEEEEEEEEDLDENELDELIAAGAASTDDGEEEKDEEEVALKKPVFLSPLSARLHRAVQEAMDKENDADD